MGLQEMQENDEAPGSHPLCTEAFIRDLARAEMTHSTAWAPAPPKPPRGFGYHLRWIVINILLVAAGAYTFTHYLTLRALGPSADDQESSQGQSASQTSAAHRRSRTN